MSRGPASRGAAWRALLACLVMWAACAGAENGVLSGVVSADSAVIAGVDASVSYYNRGNAAYRAGRYVEAVGHYRRSIDSGAHNGMVYQNLGNAHFRLGQLGHAILNYERSVRLDPGNTDARANLEFVRLLIADRVKADAPEAHVQETAREVLTRLVPDWLAIGLLIGLFGVCGVAAWWILGGGRSGLTISTLVVAAALAAVSAGAAGLQAWASDEGTAAIVLERQVEARFEPSANAKVGFVLHEGTKVQVQRREDGWTLVEIASGLRGWVPYPVLAII